MSKLKDGIDYTKLSDHAVALAVKKGIAPDPQFLSSASIAKSGYGAGITFHMCDEADIVFIVPINKIQSAFKQLYQKDSSNNLDIFSQKWVKDIVAKAYVKTCIAFLQGKVKYDHDRFRVHNGSYASQEEAENKVIKKLEKRFEKNLIKGLEKYLDKQKEKEHTKEQETDFELE